MKLVHFLFLLKAQKKTKEQLIFVSICFFAAKMGTFGPNNLSPG
jgi:hypothetical protein